MVAEVGQPKKRRNNRNSSSSNNKQNTKYIRTDMLGIVLQTLTDVHL
jgi:hypothetical protein